MSSVQERLIELIRLAAKENGGEFPQMEWLSEAERRVVECILVADKEK